MSALALAGPDGSLFPGFGGAHLGLCGQGFSASGTWVRTDAADKAVSLMGWGQEAWEPSGRRRVDTGP